MRLGREAKNTCKKYGRMAQRLSCSVSFSMVPREIAFHSQHLGKFELDSRWLTFWQNLFYRSVQPKQTVHTSAVSLTQFNSGKRIEKEKTS